MSMQTDSLNNSPYLWGKCTFWYNADTQNFEVYGPPYGRYNFHPFNVGGIWVAEMLTPGEPTPVVMLSGLSIFRGWNLCELLSLVTLLHTQDTHCNIFEKFEESERLSLARQAKQLIDTAPDWINEIQSKKSS